MVSLLALCVSAVLICVIHGLSLSDLVEGDISIPAHPLLAVCTLGISILAGIFAGLYPAIYATSVKPAVALKAHSDWARADARCALDCFACSSSWHTHS